MGKCRILVVDDDLHVLDSVAELLGDDHEVLTATGGEEGLAVLEGERVHVVISDYKMPGMDGLSFLLEVRKQYPRTSRVLMTAYADMDLVVRAMNEGEIDRFASKPYKPFEFLRIVDDCCAISLASEPVPDELTEKKTVVIGHDSHVLTLRLNLLLSQTYEVLTSSNGLEVIEMVSTRPVAGLILGMSLANIDGPVVAEYLKKERKASFPIVLLSEDLSCPQGYLDSVGADLWIDARSKTADQQLRDYLRKNLP
jgi:DNA-binding NtrC family response regulator